MTDMPITSGFPSAYFLLLITSQLNSIIPTEQNPGRREHRVLPTSEQGGRGLGSRDGVLLCSGSSMAASGEVEVRTPDKEARESCDHSPMGWRWVSENKRLGMWCIKLKSLVTKANWRKPWVQCFGDLVVSSKKAVFYHNMWTTACKSVARNKPGVWE